MKKIIYLIISVSFITCFFMACEKENVTSSEMKTKVEASSSSIELPPSPLDSINNRKARKSTGNSSVFPPGEGNY